MTAIGITCNALNTCHGCGVAFMLPGQSHGLSFVVNEHPDGPLFGIVCWCMKCRPDRLWWLAEQVEWWERFNEAAKGATT